MIKSQTRGIAGFGLILFLGLIFWNGCAKKDKYNWTQAQTIYREMVGLNQKFKAMVYADSQPTLRKLYQKSADNIEKLNQLRGQLKIVDLPVDWKLNFDQGLQANISYYKSCQLIIDKRVRQGQSYDEFRDAARDALSFYQQAYHEGWPELSRETFQVAAKIEGLIVASQPRSVPKTQRQIVVVERASSPRIIQPFVIARGAGICPASQVRYLTESDLMGCSAWELDVMRNEICARHGRRFVKAKYQAYFGSQSWYEINPNYSDSLLSPVEKYNIGFIAQYQRRNGMSTG